MTAIGAIVLTAAWLLAILGGLGVQGLGRDSRDLGVRGYPQDRGWRSLLSR